MKTSYLLKNLIVSFIVLAVLSCGSSQTVTNDSKEVTEQIDRKDARLAARQQLIEDLNLREDQRAEVQSIVQKSQEQMRELRESGGDRRAKMQQMQALSTETENKLRLILDDEQFKTYQAFREKQREEMRAGMQNRGGNRRGL